MYVVENMSGQRMPLDVPGSDDLHFNTLTMGFTNNHLLSYVPDLPTKLHKSTGFGQLARYQLAADAEVPFIPYSQSRAVTTGAVGISEDGDWMVAEVMGAGLVRIDTHTRKIFGFSNYVHKYGVGSDAHMTFQITNDGGLVAAFDYNISPVVYTANYMGCGVSTNSYDEEFETRLRGTSCPTDEGRLYDALIRKFTAGQARSMRAAGFSNDGDALYFDQYVYEDENDWMNPTVYRTPLHAGGYIKNRSIEYIALGDSFTSGEGDIEKKSDGSLYYLPGTENKNQCHQSSRSYPFLLSEEKAIGLSRMYSVACSGAQILPDYMAPLDSYLGQGNRLKNLSASTLKDTRQAALSNFTPGIIPQLEFVKKYQPKVITLMGGGNDVGFGSILEYCASPTWEMMVTDDTCGYAIEDHPLRKSFTQTILSQYDYTLMLLRKIKQASPATTIYVVGYPSFISDKPGVNCFNSAALDSSERQMINEGITFMNTMLKDAATSMGVRYLDIQDTLEGGRLCEGSEYVTGVTNVMTQTSGRDSHELFHPNARAHEKFAERFLAKGFQVEAGLNTETLSTPVELNIPSYFGSADQVQTVQNDITDDVATEQSTIPLTIANGSLAGGSEATLTMYSNTISLGKVRVSDDGSLNTKVTLPSVLKPGRHVLVLDGSSPSGEPLQYFQFVTIISKIQNDADGDGVIDADDPCTFITAWIDEGTGEDVCSQEVSTLGDETGNEILSSGQLNESSDAGPTSSLSSPTPSDQVAQIDKKSEKGRRADISDESQGDPVILGARTGTNNVPENGDNPPWKLFGGIITVSTLLLGYGIVRLLRR